MTDMEVRDGCDPEVRVRLVGIVVAFVECFELFNPVIGVLSKVNQAAVEEFWTL